MFLWNLIVTLMALYCFFKGMPQETLLTYSYHPDAPSSLFLYHEFFSFTYFEAIQIPWCLVLFLFSRGQSCLITLLLCLECIVTLDNKVWIHKSDALFLLSQFNNRYYPFFFTSFYIYCRPWLIPAKLQSVKHQLFTILVGCLGSPFHLATFKSFNELQAWNIFGWWGSSIIPSSNTTIGCTPKV